ncbi:M15 family metallopeptidase [Leucobacter iarius]|uniref:M15 family metallopeptidase n=1 Tax=Leucobacter iarius TaxID=333963 RepID=A0ABN2LSK7_9MICO
MHTEARRNRIPILLALIAAAATVTAVALAGCSGKLHAPGGTTMPVGGPSAAQRTEQPQQSQQPQQPEGDGSIQGDNGIAVDADHAAITGLKPELHAALLRAAEGAKEAGVELRVTSGWRSRELQQQLLDAAVQQYGSEAEASKWVDTPDRSLHVTGDAVDVGMLDASIWLGDNGQRFGLCRAFENERWHFELAPDGGTGQCPALLPDPSFRR